MSRAREIAKTGGAIYNGTLGATTPAAGSFTTVGTSGAATFSDSVTLLKTTADANLEVQTTFAGADARLNLYGNSTGTSQIRFGDEASVNVGLLTYNHADDSLTARVGGSDALTIDSAGAATFSGTVYTEELEISAADNLRLRFLNDVTFKGGIQVATTAADMIATSAVDDLAIRSQANILFSTGGNIERLRIDASGNLDIGSPYPITGLRGNRRLVLNDNDQGVDFVAYASDNGVSAGQYIGGFLFGNDDNNTTEDHFAGMWANASSTAGSMDLRFAAGRDNYENDTPQMILDASGNLLVGKTTTTFGTAGIALRGTVADFTRDGGTPINVNRLTSDGSLIDFHKAGTVVGSIGVDYGIEFYMGGGGGGFYINPASIRPTTGGNSNTLSDNTHDLGSGSHRFKDLYLSGSANVANVFAGGSVTSSFFTTGTFNYTSGTTAIITIPGNTTYLFMARPTNYGGGDSRHGAVYIIRRWGGHTANAVQLAQSASNYGVFTVSAAGTVSYSGTGGGLPSTPIYWMRIA